MIGLILFARQNHDFHSFMPLKTYCTVFLKNQCVNSFLHFFIGIKLITFSAWDVPIPHPKRVDSFCTVQVLHGLSGVTQPLVACQSATRAPPPPRAPSSKSYGLVVAIIYCWTKRLQTFSYCFKLCKV